MALLSRVVIYPKDIQLITGKSERSARMIMARMRGVYKKEKHQLISTAEFCEYMGLRMEDIEKAIR